MVVGGYRGYMEQDRKSTTEVHLQVWERTVWLEFAKITFREYECWKRCLCDFSLETNQNAHQPTLTTSFNVMPRESSPANLTQKSQTEK